MCRTQKNLELGLFSVDMSILDLLSRCVSRIGSLIPLEVNFMDMLPQHLTAYRREYLEDEQGIRATIDTDLIFSDDFSFNLTEYKPSRYFYDSIVELKSPVQLFDRFGKIRQSFPLPSVRCSKYVLGQSLLRGFCYL